MDPGTDGPRTPTSIGREDGLSFALWLPDRPVGGVVILHGAGSRKENHFDVAATAASARLAAIVFDQRGHGESDGPFDSGAVADVAMIASLLPPGPVSLRGSSMGGWLALAAAEACGAAAVVAICPATSAGLAEGLRTGRLEFDAHPEAAEGIEAIGDPIPDRIPILLMHAEGDETVPVERSRELAERLTHPASRFVEVPGGHHRSIQHDPDLVAESIDFLRLRLTAGQAAD